MGLENNKFNDLDIFFNTKEQPQEVEESDNIEEIEEIEEIEDTEETQETTDESFEAPEEENENVSFDIDPDVDLDHEERKAPKEKDALSKLFDGSEKAEDWTKQTQTETIADGAKELFKIPFKYWKYIIGGMFAVSAICANFVCHSQVFNLITKLLKVCGVEALSMGVESFGNFAIKLCYIVNVVIGGLALFGIQKLAIKLFEAIEFAEGKKITLLILGALGALFFIGSLICLLAGKGLTSYMMYRWLGPTLAYGGALFFNLLTNFKSNNDY